MRYAVHEIKKLGTILGIYAHPDDECWTAGGVLAAACGNGQKVVCVTATRGESGQTADASRWPQAQLGSIREQELEASLACLGAIEHEWLDYKDGTLNNVPAQVAVDRLAAIIKRVHPDTILTFGSDGLTGHPDHKTVSDWAQAAAKVAGSGAVILAARESAEKYESCGKTLDQAANIYFATKKPTTVAENDADVFFTLPSDIYQKKLASLRAHHSQMDGIFAHPQGGPALQEYAQSECFVRL